MTEDQELADQAGEEDLRDDAAEATEGEDRQDPEGESEDSQEEVSKSKARRERRKARMDALEQEAREAKAEAERVRKRLQEFEDKSKAAKPPKETDFGTYDEYLSALAAHNAGAEWDRRQRGDFERQEKAEQERLQRLQAQREAELHGSWEAQTEEARARYSDFDAVVMAHNVPITRNMATLIMDSDHAADLAYHIASRPEQAAKLAQMDGDPVRQARAIGAIEARLSTPRPQTKSEAPQPIKPAKPQPSSPVKDPANMSMDEWIAARKAGKI